ncbi:hypothetical protein [Pedobacter punctiformis]|uniref:Uncharacterized protein n=1 Tax=Pedobacter punctiformis TaxID=3004097 RepID=A0ABT4L3W7_9SPHI|nr:hypothetical protein [Pedobacter sp. HCMS5-2]MCZ4242622.1 hypothetical protein [Pedobacter sp. HCMS5-2]
MIPIDDIRKNYKRFDDETIKKIALNPKGIRKDIAEVLNEEIRNRKLGIGLIKWINLETDSYEGSAREELLSKIKQSICTNCDNGTNLNGYQFTTIYSFVIGSTRDVKTKIICSNCAGKMRSRSMFLTFLCGWWSPGGIFATPFSLIFDAWASLRTKKYSKEILDAFIAEYTGTLRAIEESNQKIEFIIKKFNESSTDTESDELFS